MFNNLKSYKMIAFYCPFNFHELLKIEVDLKLSWNNLEKMIKKDLKFWNIFRLFFIFHPSTREGSGSGSGGPPRTNGTMNLQTGGSKLEVTRIYNFSYLLTRLIFRLNPNYHLFHSRVTCPLPPSFRCPI